MNHVTRTFFYQALHMLAAGVQPLFVFDGPNKPLEKGVRHPATVQPCVHVSSRYNQDDFFLRNNGILASSDRSPEDKACERELNHIIALSREILDLLGIPHQNAPGEAEAECTALEKSGIVDAVLTRDGDAFVFGGRRILRKLKTEDGDVRVIQYLMGDLEAARPTLRRQDLFLVAMMSGGDYDDGIRGCGPKTAIEAARAGFSGKLEALIKHHGADSLRKWREEIIEELRHNGRGKLSQVYVAVSKSIGSDFPNPTIANYYLSPTVSPNLGELLIDWDKEASAQGLREWTQVYFDWKHALLSGKFVRVLSHPLLVKSLVRHIARKTDGSHLIESIARIKGNDDEVADQELRVCFKASQVVDVDISGERIVPGYEANLKSVFDPSTLLREWVPRWIIEHGAPEAFREWEAASAKTKTKKAAKAKRHASVSTPSAQDITPKRPRKTESAAVMPSPELDDAHTAQTATARRTSSGGNVQTSGTGRQTEVVEVFDDLDEFPDLSKHRKFPAARKTTARRTSPDKNVKASGNAHQTDFVDLTSD
jgi:Holliday junction resolvase YEN1